MSASAIALAGVVGLGTAATPAVAADNCANAEFRTGWSAHLPDCRAYEMVTPADKGGNSLVYKLDTNLQPPSGSGSRLTPSVSGDQFFTEEATTFAAPHGMGVSQLVSVRSSGGWQTTNIAPRACRSEAVGVLWSGTWQRSALAADFSVAAFQSVVKQDGADMGCDPGDQAGKDVYRVDLDGSLDWVSQNGQSKTEAVDAQSAGISADGKHVLFTTPQRLLPEDDGRTVGSGLYDRVGGQTVAVGLSSDGTLVNACGAQAVGGTWNISRDNRVIFFTSGKNEATVGCRTADGGGQLYARIDASRTVKLSASQLATPAAARVPTFLEATSDGRKVYFTSTEQLTEDADVTGGLYEYDLGPVLDGAASAGLLRFLSPSVDGNPAGVSRLARVVGNGEQVFFTATGVLAAGAPTSGTKLYRTAGGETTLILERDPYDVSLNGAFVTFLASPAGEPHQQAYRVDVNGGAPVCVSCPPSDAPASGPGTFMNTALFAGAADRFGDSPFVTRDGRVFFGTGERLVEGDTDNYYDIYEYHGGEHRLVTPGTDSEHATLIAVTADGRDVFLTTASSLVAKDFDNGDLDVYVARAGGGFLPPAPDPVPCAGDACQGAVPAPGTGVLPTTTWFRGLGNVPAPAAQQRDEDEDDASKPRVSKVKTVRGTSTRIRVRVPGEGRIRTSGSGLRRSHKTAKSEKAKTYRVSVRLSSRAKRTLSRKGRVRVRVTVRFTPEEGKRTSTRVNVTFRKKGKNSSRANERSHAGASRASGKDGQ